MKNDLIEEIRKVRCNISEQFPEIHSFIEHYKKLDKEYANRLLHVPYDIKKHIPNQKEIGFIPKT